MWRVSCLLLLFVCRLAFRDAQYGTELNADHPGFHDQEYRRRRVEITENARKYRSGEPIPRVPYTEREQLTWKTVYETLTALREKYACSDFKVAFRDLETGCSFSADQIPQLDDVSNYLKRQTGWTIRPVSCPTIAPHIVQFFLSPSISTPFYFGICFTLPRARMILCCNFQPPRHRLSPIVYGTACRGNDNPHTSLPHLSLSFFPPLAASVF